MKRFKTQVIVNPESNEGRGRHVEAYSPEEEDNLQELDGEQLGGLPAHFEILPRHLLIKGYV
jgi:diacylglycerol kinase family enzyme